MTGYVLAKLARDQLKKMYFHTEQRWGEAQADRYTRILFEAFDRIGGGTARSRAISSAFEAEGYFCTCQQHFIYWRRQRSGRAEIVAVVDQRMLQDRQIRRAFGLPA